MLHTILLVFALVLFVIGSIFNPLRINLIGLGLACWILAELLGKVRLLKKL